VRPHGPGTLQALAESRIPNDHRRDVIHQQPHAIILDALRFAAENRVRHGDGVVALIP
jgi:hypothetical protein